jgi:hypothetical protein
VHLQFVSAGGKNFNDTTRAHVSVCFSAHGGERNGGAEDCALPLFAAPLINDHRIIITLSLSLSLAACALLAAALRRAFHLGIIILLYSITEQAGSNNFRLSRATPLITAIHHGPSISGRVGGRMQLGALRCGTLFLCSQSRVSFAYDL